MTMENKVKSLIDQYDNLLNVGVVTDADTILADIMGEAAEEGFEITGLGKEILSQWFKTSDRHTYEVLFENLTGCSFMEYLDRVSDAQTKTEEKQYG